MWERDQSGQTLLLASSASTAARHGRRQTCARSTPTRAGSFLKRGPRDAYDWLYILAADGCETLIRECLHGRRSVSPPAYRLGAVAESG